MRRTHNCGELNAKAVGKEVKLNGWVNSRRDHGGIIFIDLRDRFGLTQIVFDPEVSKEAHKEAEHLRREDVLYVKGAVKHRKQGMVNPKLKTGEVEIFVDEMEILNRAETPPLEVDDKKTANEEMRLKYRYLDLRRPMMQKHLLIRHNAMQAAREFLNSKGFLEIETPMLMRHTPEGARDYIVPSRIHPGKVYSLPQSPQIYKQLLMVSGCDRYYQMARCLRDEDLRADRQPEFTQIDLEMSFVEEEDIFKLIDGLMEHVFKKAIIVELKTPFPKIPYKEAIEKYGTDKPDIRFDTHLIDITEEAAKSEFETFKDVVNRNGAVKCINAKKCGKYTRKEIDELTDFASKHGAKGLAYMRMRSNKLESSVAKFFSNEVQEKMIHKTKAEEGDLLLMVADQRKKVNEILGQLRLEIARREKLLNDADFKFCWVVDFPLFEWDEENNRWSATHHVFTMPKKEHIQYLETNPGKVRAQCYDLVLNGIEIASGSIRIHLPELQEKVMKVIGLSKEKSQEKFGFLLEAFKYGAPPHGGIASGFDRLVALMCGYNDIREVIAFPKTRSAENPMDGSPSEVDEAQLKELHIKLDILQKEGKK